jgi:outer membrane lipoprotein-sorting protein
MRVRVDRQDIPRGELLACHRHILVILALSIFILSPVASACDADSVISLFESKINGQEIVSLKYHKEARSLLFGDRLPEDGKIWLGPPDRYRVETSTQTVVRGTDTLWTYSPETKQVTIRAGDLDSMEFGPVGFFGSLREDFFAVDCRTDLFRKRDVWKIRLAAKTETAAIQRLTLWIDMKSRWVSAAEYVDYNEETTYLVLTDYKPGRSKDEKQFIFVVPQGVERVVLPVVTKSSSTNTEN